MRRDRLDRGRVVGSGSLSIVSLSIERSLAPWFRFRAAFALENKIDRISDESAFWNARCLV